MYPLPIYPLYPQHAGVDGSTCFVVKRLYLQQYSNLILAFLRGCMFDIRDNLGVFLGYARNVTVGHLGNYQLNCQIVHIHATDRAERVANIER